MTAVSDTVARALQKGAAAQRLDEQEALSLVAAMDVGHLHRLGEAAFTNRCQRHGMRGTYVTNVQINPSNICSMGCSFCNYAAHPDDPHAYVLQEDEIIAQVENARPTEVHIVGGLNRVWPYERNLALVVELRRRFPRIHIKAFTAVEIDFFAKTSGRSEEAVLQALIDAGVDALPGGGAEIFSQRLYRKHWKNKIGPQGWLRIHALAHRLGLLTNATMLFGFGETWTERISHLFQLRQAQDETGGFHCFIPLPFQPGSSAPAHQRRTPMEILAVLALSRLVLDNVLHIKAYWPMTGLETAAAGLSWGADDLDGTIEKERIAHLAGAVTPGGLAREQMIETIETAGFEPFERNGRFERFDRAIAADGGCPGQRS